MPTELDAMLEERRTRYAIARREFDSYTLDALWTLRDRMERNGSDAGPRYQALTDTLSQQRHYIPFTK
jgi:hypothetical protein